MNPSHTPSRHLSPPCSSIHSSSICPYISSNLSTEISQSLTFWPFAIPYKNGDQSSKCSNPQSQHWETCVTKDSRIESVQSTGAKSISSQAMLAMLGNAFLKENHWPFQRKSMVNFWQIRRPLGALRPRGRRVGRQCMAEIRKWGAN